MRYVVALYEVDRAYGGPEEGGWFYDTGRLARLLRLCAGEAAAIGRAARANRLLQRLQGHKRPVDSAAYDGGRYAAVVFERSAPEHYPEQRPRYE